jgi:hypothetical protein
MKFAVSLPGRIPPIAILPFLDLTEEMNQEPFADGMTEEPGILLSSSITAIDAAIPGPRRRARALLAAGSARR